MTRDLLNDLIRVVVLASAWLALVVGIDLVLREGLPGLPARSTALIIIALVSSLLVAGVGFAQWWRAIGYVPVREWRQTIWLAPVALIALAPLVGGMRPLGLDAFVVLAVGYGLAGFAEETMFRGVMVKILERYSSWLIAGVTALLFGLVHFGNVLLRGDPGVVAMEAVGVAAFGFGFAALRLRIGAVLPLIALHAVFDLVLQISTLPLVPVVVVQDAALFALGLVLLARRRRSGAQAPANPTR